MSEERLQEIKDSVDFQYKLAKAKCIDNALLFADEEKELIDEIERLRIIQEKYKDSQLYIKDFKEEIERLNNIIKEVREYIEDLYDVRFTDKDKRKILEILDKGE